METPRAPESISLPNRLLEVGKRALVAFGGGAALAGNSPDLMSPEAYIAATERQRRNTGQPL